MKRRKWLEIEKSMNAFRTLGQKWAYNTGKGRGSINLSFYRRRKSKRRAKTDGPLYSGDSSYSFSTSLLFPLLRKPNKHRGNKTEQRRFSPCTPLIECANKYEKKQQKEGKRRIRSLEWPLLCFSSTLINFPIPAVRSGWHPQTRRTQPINGIFSLQTNFS